MAKPALLLSFDVEEFDLPLEYKHDISIERQLQIGSQGLHVINELMRSYPQVRSTYFTTGFFAEHFPKEVCALAETNEIASHAFFHSEFTVADLARSKQSLEKITGMNVHGLRMPRMRPVSMADVQAAGYDYDSSINPAWVPGRYDNRHLPRNPYMEEGMLRFPASVTPKRRIPLFWLSFKNIPYPLYRQMLRRTLQQDGYACLYFHPWEFVSLDGFGLPFYVRRHAGPVLLRKLRRLLDDFAGICDFMPMMEYIENRHFLSAEVRF
jgi:peptidoglycan/xylan/chitin deacetylase (PgdA/CDA1 family)